MASKSKTLAELLNGDVTIDATDIADGSVTGPKLADNLNYDSGTLYLDSTNNRIGIGTVSPSAKLELNNGGAGSLVTFTDGVNANFNFSTTSLLGTFGTDAGSTALALKTSGTERMRIDNSGKVGIGTTASPYELTIANSSDVTLAIENKSSVTSGNRGTFSCFNSAGSTVGVVRFGADTDNVGTNIQFWGRPVGGSITEHMRIDSSGNTGIGSTTPTTYATNTKVMQITTNGNDVGVGASIRQAPWTSYQGRGYKHSEVFALSNITSSTQISQLQGTGANGFRCLFEYIVTGHTSGIGNGHFWGKYYWEGGTSAPVLIQADYEENATLQITFDTSVSNRLQLFLASHNATNGFNGIAEVTYWVPVDFASSNYTTS